MRPSNSLARWIGCALAAASLSAESRGGSLLDGWSHRAPIAFTNPVSGTLTNFPALVILGSNTIPGFAYSQFGSTGGADLRFADAGRSVELNYEVESWDTNGSSYVWVQVPALAGTNERIYAYWGSEAGVAPCTTNGAAWSSGFEGVWHLSGTAGSQPDSTTNAHAATPHGSVATGAAGMVSGAVRLAGTNGYLSVLHDARLALTTDLVVEAWFKMNAFPATFAGLVAKSPSSYATGWFLTYSANSHGTPKYTSYIPSAGQYMAFAGTPDLNWHHLAFRFVGGVRTLFIDGTQTPGSTSGAVVDSGTDLLFGRIDDGHGYYLNGLLDEIRVSSVARGSNWLHASWLNQRANAAFCRYGPVEPMTTSLGVQVLDATAIGPTNATLNGRLMGVGQGGNPLVFAGWGEYDAGTNDIFEWPNSACLGSNWGPGEALSTNVGGLVTGRTYACRWYVTNSAGSAWSDSAAFTTIGPPSVSNAGAWSVGDSSAWLQGAVTDTGGETPLAWFLYWRTGGSVTNALDAGRQDGAFSARAVDLVPESAYTYEVLASNSAGLARSGTRAFTTAEPVVRGTYRLRISFTNAVAGVLTNFPVLVALGADAVPGFSYAQFAAPGDGADLSFADSTESIPLNHEIERWNSNGASYVWVQVPTLAGTGDFIHAYWGPGANVTSAPSASGVWSNGFRGVWHLGGTGATQPDSTTNGSTAVPQGGVATGSVGMIDGAVHLDGSNGYLSVPHSAAIAMTDNFTVEAWFKRDAYGAFDGLVSKLSDTFTRGWNLNFDNNSKLFGAYIPGGYRLCDGGSRQNDFAWHYFVLRVQGGYANLFLDGVQQSVNSAVAITDSAKPLVFGRFDVDVADHYLNGSLDEIRISAVPRGSNWLHACWLNQRSNSTFVTYGSPMSIGPPEVLNDPPTGVTTTAATMNGRLVSSGSSATTAGVFWGTHDSGPTWDGWSNTNWLPYPAEAGALSVTVPVTDPHATYYYRFYATNSAGARWGDPASFFGLPLVDNGGGVVNLTWSSVTLRGAVAGWPAASVFIYWGELDAGTNRALWQHAIAMGEGTNGSFLATVPIAPGATNYYRCFASNVFGEVWAAYAVAFTSPIAKPAAIGRFSVDPGSNRPSFSIVFDGNSWVYGSGATGGSNFPNQTKALLQDAGKTATILNYGVAGQTISAMQSDAPTQIDRHHTNYDILVGLEIVNQWGQTAQTKEQVYAAYRQYFMDRKAAGFAFVFACTPHDQGFYARGDWSVVRPYCVEQMKAEFPALGIGVIDCGSDPRLSDWTDRAYFATDRIHLNNSGQAIQAEYVFRALMETCQGGGAGIAWTATNGWSYTLEATPTLLPSAWAPVSPYTNMTGAGPMAVSNIAVGTNHALFFRVLSAETP